MKEVLHMRVGRNIGQVMLEIAQEHIINGDPEKAITTYTDCFCGITKEYALMLLKGDRVLEATEDGTSVNMTDNPNACKDNKHNLYKWDAYINDMYRTLKDLCYTRALTIRDFGRYSHADINDFCISKPVAKYFGEENMQTGVIGIHHLAARVLAGDDLSHAGSGATAWTRLEEHVENEDPDTKEYEYILYYIVRYVNIIKQMYKEYIRFEKVYNFLLKNGFIKKICCIEEDIEAILSFIYEFCDLNKGYHHPLCDEAIAALKDTIDNELRLTDWGMEYHRDGIIKKDVMDGYDAGWLSPDGEFYGNNGEKNCMIHMCIAEQLYDGKLSEQMKKDGVKKSFCDILPERWLEQKGWMKLSRDEIYGYFYADKKGDPDFPYCPTEKQVKIICDYADKFYNGKFYITPKVIENTEPVTAYKVRQMDEIKLHQTFYRL